MTDRRQRLIGGLLSVIVGALAAAMIYWHPEQLRVPAWVAYAACSAFVFAGVTIMTNEFALYRLQAWLIAGCAAALLVPFVWIAFGPGERQCSVTLPFVSTTASDLVCRGAFGLGALLGAMILALVVLRAFRQQKAK